MTAPLVIGIGIVSQWVPLQEESPVLEVRPSRKISVADPMAGPRQLCPVRNPGAVSAMVILLLVRLPSSRTIVITAGPIADSCGNYEIGLSPTCRGPKHAGRARDSQRSVTCMEMCPSDSGAREPTLFCVIRRHDRSVGQGQSAARHVGPAASAHHEQAALLAGAQMAFDHPSQAGVRVNRVAARPSIFERGGIVEGEILDQFAGLEDGHRPGNLVGIKVVEVALHQRGGGGWV